jgi:hypothetical protein
MNDLSAALTIDQRACAQFCGPYQSSCIPSYKERVPILLLTYPSHQRTPWSKPNTPTWLERSPGRPSLERMVSRLYAPLLSTNQGVKGLEKTDNNLAQTSWPIISMINQKNYYT